MSGTSGPPRDAPVRLAHERSFAIGALRIDPATRQAIHPDGASETLEPRVMEVLVALNRARTAILSRDDLIQACWNGIVVGEDAIQRVIQRLRRLARETGAFRIETITKVGYRLLPDGVAPPTDEAAAQAATPPARRTKRPALALTLAAGTVVAALGAWWYADRGEPDRQLHLAPAVALSAAGGDVVAPVVLTQTLRRLLHEQQVVLSGRGEDLVATPSFRQSGDIAVVGLNLENRKTGTTLWIGEREAPAGDARAFTAAVRQLSGILTCGMQAARDDRSAPDEAIFPLQLDFCAGTWDDPGRRRQIAREMAAAQPESPLGWYALALAESISKELPGADHEASRKAGLEAIGNYRALRPESADGLALEAMLTRTDRPVQRERLLREASNELTFVRCVCPIQFLGDFLMQSGRIAAANAQYRRALEQEPGDPLAHYRAFLGAELAGRRDAADREAARYVEITADPIRIALRKALWRNDADQAGIVIADLADETHGFHAAVRQALEALVSGNGEARRAAASRLARIPREEADERLLLELFALLGDRDRAFSLLEKSRRDGGSFSAPGRIPGMTQPLLFSPALRSLWRDPRFAAHLRRAGFIEYWRATGSRPDLCEADGSPPFCASLPTPSDISKSRPE